MFLHLRIRAALAVVAVGRSVSLLDIRTDAPEQAFDTSPNHRVHRGDLRAEPADTEEDPERNAATTRKKGDFAYLDNRIMSSKDYIDNAATRSLEGNLSI